MYPIWISLQYKDKPMYKNKNTSQRVVPLIRMKYACVLCNNDKEGVVVFSPNYDTRFRRLESGSAGSLSCESVMIVQLPFLEDGGILSILNILQCAMHREIACVYTVLSNYLYLVLKKSCMGWIL